jgi:Tfp pilus assembly protein PilO
MNIPKIDVKEIIEKLKTIDLKELQNIDADQVQEALRRRPDVIVNALLIIVTLAVTFNAVNGYGRRSKTLDWEIKKMQERADALVESKRLEEEHETFMKSFPEAILVDQIGSKLSEFAADRHVQIVSFSPEKEKSDEYVKVTRVRLEVATADYRNLVLFIRDIEDAPRMMRVEKWTGRIKEGAALPPRGQESQEGVEVKEIIVASMEIGSVALEN